MLPNRAKHLICLFLEELSTRITIIGVALQTSTMETFATVLATPLFIISVSGWAFEAISLTIDFLT